MRCILYVQYTNPAGYPPLEHSSRILADAGWKVLFLGTGALGTEKLNFAAHPNIEVRCWRLASAGLGQKIHFFAFNLWVLVTALSWRPNWIYSSDVMSCPAGLVLKHLGFRVLYHEHDSPRKVEGRKSKIENFLLWTRKRLARCADLCVLPNERRVEMFGEETGRNGQTLCVWNCPLREDAKVESDRHDQFTVLYQGSIVPARVPLALIEAMAKLPTLLRLRIAGYETIGHGGYIAKLKRHAELSGVAERIEFMGALSRSKLLPETRKAQVGLCLLPLESDDLNEGTMTGASNKPFEYMACGLALLVTDRPDWNNMFVEPGYARHCNPTDSDSIAVELQWFYEHAVETKEKGESGRQRILQEWNYESWFETVKARIESNT